LRHALPLAMRQAFMSGSAPGLCSAALSDRHPRTVRDGGVVHFVGDRPSGNGVGSALARSV